MAEARQFVIGDVHGCVDELERLLEAIAPEPGDTVCFLGDYIDRGPSPRGVVERLLQLRREGPTCHFLKGNHEDMFLAFLGARGRHGESFLANGGGPTLASYGIEGFAGTQAAARLPEDHRAFYLELATHVVIGTHYCVHAGVRPTRPLEAQEEEDQFWIRAEFIDGPHPFPYTVLFGHTPFRNVLVDLPYKVGLDTGCVYGNLLSCLELGAQRVWQVARGSQTVHTRPLVTDGPS